jgi:hypothetical protein
VVVDQGRMTPELRGIAREVECPRGFCVLSIDVTTP